MEGRSREAKDRPGPPSPKARSARQRLVIPLLPLSLLLALAPPTAPIVAQICVSGGTSDLPAPDARSLRGYRASFSSPTRLAVDELGQVYVADPARGTVVVRAADGGIVSVVEGLGSPASIAVEADGNRIYVGDGVDGRVSAYSAQWVHLFDLGKGSRELAFPGDIALDPDNGNVWVTDSPANLVRVYDASGHPLFDFGGRGSGAGQFQFPTGIFVDAAADEVLVADQLNGRIQIFDRLGSFESCIGAKGSGSGRLNMPQGVWVDGIGRIYVSDAFEGWVHVVDHQGATVAFIGDVGEGAGQLSTPSDVVVDPSGRLFVSSTTTARLELFGIDGYSDPERFAPAEIELSPDPFSPASSVSVAIEIPGYRLELVPPETITANGVPSVPGLASVGDVDGDYVPDLTVVFEGAALAATLSPEGGTVRVTGRLGDSLELEGFTDVGIGGQAPAADADGDGIANERDACPDTPSGSPISADGCSLEQLCPCSRPAPGAKWTNHGEYVSCVVASIAEITHPPLDRWQQMHAIREASRSSCGRKAVTR